MTATALDSAIFRDIFSTEAMRRVFSDEKRTEFYLDIEATLARNIDASLEAVEEILGVPVIATLANDYPGVTRATAAGADIVLGAAS